jgi:hypothetical protein
MEDFYQKARTKIQPTRVLERKLIGTVRRTKRIHSARENNQMYNEIEKLETNSTTTPTIWKLVLRTRTCPRHSS